jgi:hypothetical protein
MTRFKKSFSKTSDLARAYARRELTEGKAREGRVFVEGDTIYSYGHHFPIAHRIRDNEYLLNEERYSTTTGKQQSAVRSALNSEGAKIVETDTSGIKHAMEHKEEYE